MRHHHNRSRFDAALEPGAALAIRHLSPWNEAVAEIQSWPGYAPTPLWRLDGFARTLGVRSVYYKDESQRFGRALGSFKALGAPFAVSQLLAGLVELETGYRPSSSELRSGSYRHLTRNVTVCVATDGNQGRGLAWAAQQFGCQCVVFIHRHVSEYRQTAMEALGARVIRVNGEYELSVQEAKAHCATHGWHFVSSTSWDHYRGPISRNVMRGYMIMIEETLRQLPPHRPITHVLAQAGVGSIPAAIFMGLREHWAPQIPRFIVVEPHEADCVYRSAVEGKPTPATGSLRTIMAGLACREVSPAAWSILHWLTSDLATIPDESAAMIMRAFALGEYGDPPIVAGESAVGGAALLALAAHQPSLRDALGLAPDSEILLFGCEGATDPSIYSNIVGLSPHQVFERQFAYLEPPNHPGK